MYLYTVYHYVIEFYTYIYTYKTYFCITIMYEYCIYIYICVSVHPFKAEDRNGMKEPTSTSKAGRLVATLLWLWQEARIVWILIVLP